MLACTYDSTGDFLLPDLVHCYLLMLQIDPRFSLALYIKALLILACVAAGYWAAFFY